MTKQKISKEELLAKSPIGKTLLTLAIPSIISSAILLLYNFIDTYFIGLLHDDLALAAVGVAFPIFNFAAMLGVFFSTAANVLVSRNYGSGDLDEAAKASGKSFIFSCLVSLFSCCVIFAFFEPILRFMGATDSILPMSKDFAKWIVLMMLFSVPNYVVSGSLRAQGFASEVSGAFIVSSLLNIVLDYIFIIKMNMGVGGAGLATAISNFTTFLFLYIFIMKHKEVKIRIPLKNCFPDFASIKEMFVIGASSMASSASTMIFVIVYNRTSVSLPNGELLLVAISIMVKIIVIPINVAYGFRQALLTSLSYSVGMKNMERFNAALRYSFAFMTYMSFAFVLLFHFFGRSLFSIFTDNPTVIDAGEYSLMGTSIFAAALYCSNVVMAAYQALGKLWSGTFIAVIRQGIFTPVLLLAMTSIWGLAGFYSAPALADILTGVVTIWMYLNLKKKLLKTG